MRTPSADNVVSSDAVPAVEVDVVPVDEEIVLGETDRAGEAAMGTIIDTVSPEKEAKIGELCQMYVDQARKIRRAESTVDSTGGVSNPRRDAKESIERLLRDFDEAAASEEAAKNGPMRNWSMRDYKMLAEKLREQAGNEGLLDA